MCCHCCFLIIKKVKSFLENFLKLTILKKETLFGVGVCHTCVYERKLNGYYVHSVSKFLSYIKVAGVPSTTIRGSLSRCLSTTWPLWRGWSQWDGRTPWSGSLITRSIIRPIQRWLHVWCFGRSHFIFVIYCMYYESLFIYHPHI